MRVIIPSNEAVAGQRRDRQQVQTRRKSGDAGMTGGTAVLRGLLESFAWRTAKNRHCADMTQENAQETEAKPKAEPKPAATHEPKAQPKPEAKPQSQPKPAATHESKPPAQHESAPKPAATHAAPPPAQHQSAPAHEEKPKKN